LTHLRRELPEGCISDLTFDEWRAGELGSDVVARLEAHLETCERCQARHDAIEGEAEAFLARFPRIEPKNDMPPVREAEVVSLEARRTRRFAWVSGALSLAAAAALLIALGRGGDDGAGVGSSVRTKGSPRVGFFVKHGKDVRAGGDGQVVHPGDQLRFTATTGAAQHLAILSLDAARRASVYYPKGNTSAPIGAVRGEVLDSSVELDETLGGERIWAVFCREPFELEPLRAELERLQALPNLPDCTFDEVSIVKERAP
jgi:hypothetical protein